MNIQTERLPDCRVRVHIEVPPTAVAAAREAVTNEFAKMARVPGYRPGKAPRAVVDKRFAGSIQEETKERLVKQGCQEAEKTEKLGLLGVAGIESPQFLADGSFSFTAEVVIAPEVPLPEYKGLVLSVPRVTVGDEDLDGALQRICHQFTEYKELNDEAALEGDLLQVEISTLLGGETLESKTEADRGMFAAAKTWVRLLAEDERPYDTMKLVGAKVGDQVVVPAKLPEDFAEPELAGSDVEVTFQVRGLTRVVVPEPSDELATKLGVENLEELKAKLRESLEAEAERRRRGLTETAIITALQEGARDFDLPQHLVSRQTQMYVDNIVQENLRRGIGEDQIVQHQQEIFGNAAAQAKMGVKTSYLLNEIAEKENIHVSDEELYAVLMQQASQSKVTMRKFLRDLKKNDGAGRTRNQMRTQRVLEFLISHATITEVDPPEAGPETDTESTAG